MIDISILILTLNEERFIKGILDNVLEEDGFEKEIIVADAGSSDATLGIVKELQKYHKNIFIFNNTERYVSRALNKLIPECRGEHIAILGAHAVYPEHYIKTALSFLHNHPEHAIVGGPIDHKGISATGKSIAFCMASRFGMGNSTFRTENQDQETDTVPFPVYRKTVFEKLQGYDNRLVRNQDEDFHYRAVKQGFRIFMLSGLRSAYYVRESYTGLLKQFFQYGYFKPLVMRKNSQSVKLRHWVPLLFTLYLVIATGLTFFFPVNLFIWTPIMLYCTLDLFFSISIKKTNTVISLLNLITFPVLHISYGTGMFFGLLTFTND